jgi:long-subunit acyl-CoA synthetase (AMP-forming)
MALYQPLVDAINRSLPKWSTVKDFRLVDAQLTIENGLLDSDRQIQRAQVRQRFAAAIASLYETDSTRIRRMGAVATAVSPDIALHTEPAT